MKANKKIKYGNVDLPEGFDDPKNHKLRVTTWIDGDIILELKKRADKSKGKYQTLMNDILREYLFNEKSAQKLEVEAIVENKLKALGLLKKRA